MCTMTTCRWSVLEVFGRVFEALEGGKGVSLSLPLKRVSYTLLNAQRREGLLCTCLISRFWMNQLHSHRFSLKHRIDTKQQVLPSKLLLCPSAEVRFCHRIQTLNPTQTIEQVFVCFVMLLQAAASGNDSREKENWSAPAISGVQCATRSAQWSYQRVTFWSVWSVVIQTDTEGTVRRQSCAACRRLIKKMDVWLSLIGLLSQSIVSGLNDDN